MANGADGSIIIDTELDNTGFKRGSQRMEDAQKSLTNTVNQTGKSVSDAVRSMNTVLQELGRTAQDTGSTVQNAMGAGQFDKAIGAAQKYVNNIAGQITKLGDADRIGVKTDAQMTRFQMGAEKARNALEELRQKLIQLGDSTVSNQSYESLQAEFEKLDAQMSKLYQKQAQMEAMGVKTKSLSYRRVVSELEQVGVQYDAVLAKMQAVREKGETATPAYDNESYQNLLEQFNALEAALQRVEQASSGFGDQMDTKANEAAGSVQRVGQELDQTPAKAENATQGLRGFASALRSAAGVGLRNIMSFPFKMIQSGAKAAGSGIKGLVSHLRSFMSHSKQTGLSANGLVKSLLSIKTMLLSKLKSTFINSITQGMRQGIQSLAQYSSAFNASMSGMKNAMTGLSGNISVFAGNLINALAPAITTVINLISTAISYLNAFFALIGGKKVMTVAKKGTDSYANSLGGAASAAGELKEQVYGFDELNRADDSGGGGGGGGGGGAGGGFEEVGIDSILPESLRKFMQDIIDAFNAEEFEKVGALLATGLNSIVSKVDNWINTVFRPEGVKWASNIARIMNGFVAAFDWTNLGKTIADGFNAITDILNTFLTTFDFRTLAKGFSDGINGIIDSIEWDLLGATIANALQSIHTLIWGTLAGIDWASLGINLATGVQSMFDTVDWAYVGETVYLSLKGVIDGIGTFLAGVNWQQIGTQIAGFFSNINWAGLMTSLATGINNAINGAYNLVHSFVSSVDWRSIGAAVGTFINGLEVDKWIVDAGVLLSELVTSLYTTISGFLQETDWKALGTDIWNGLMDAIATIDWEGLASSAFEYLGSVFGAASGLVAGLASAIWESLKQAWEDTKAYFQSYFDEYGGNIIDGLWAGIKNAFSTAANWIKTNIFQPFIDGFKAAFGIASPSKEMESMGQFIIDGLWNGLKNTWATIKQSVVDLFTEALDAIKGVFEGIGEWASNIWDGFKNGLSEGWTRVKDAIIEPFKNMWQAVKDFFGIASPSTEAASIGDFILQGLGQGLLDGVAAVLDTVADVFGRIWDAIKRIFGFGGSSEESKDAKQAGKDIMSGLESGIKDNENSVKDAVKNAAKNALEQFKTEFGISGSTSTKTKSFGEGLVSGVKDGIESKGVTGTFSSASTKVWNAVKDALNSAFGVREGSAASKTKYIGEGSVTGVNSGIQDKAKKGTFTSAATDTINAVKDALNSAFGLSGSGSGGKVTQTRYVGEGVVAGVVDGVQTKAVESTFSNVANAVYKAASSAFNTALGISWNSASKFKDIGKAICQGIADGINANLSTIKSAAESAAQSALNAAKNKLGIHSPSRVFAELGGFMMQGMANGLNDGQPVVRKTVASIASSITDGMGDASFDVSGEALTTGLDRVIDRLDNIARIFAAITSTIGDLGGKLPLPGIAIGEYAPPRTRADFSGKNTDITDELQRLGADRDELFYMIRDEIRNVVRAILDSETEIDGQSLERVLASLKRNRERSFGGAY